MHVIGGIAATADGLQPGEGMIKLNDSAALIGGLIDGQRDVAAIIGELDKQFPGVPELGEDIEQFMEVARAQHWIELV